MLGSRIFSSLNLFSGPSIQYRAAESLVAKVLGAFSRPKWDLSDRRSHLRHTCSLTARLQVGASTQSVKVLDLSKTGLRITVEGELTQGHSVSISDGYGSEASVCRVEWVGGGQAGLSFLRPVSASKADWLLKQGGLELLDSKRPQALRVACNLKASLVVDNKVRRANILDLGTGGATIECDGEPLADGGRVRLDFGSVGSFGRVVLDCLLVSVVQGETSRYELRFQKYYKGTGGELNSYLEYFLKNPRA